MVVLEVVVVIRLNRVYTFSTSFHTVAFVNFALNSRRALLHCISMSKVYKMRNHFTDYKNVYK